MKILVLGGYGAMGSVTATDLSLSGVDEIIVAGRDYSKAESFAAHFRNTIPTQMDATDKNLAEKIKSFAPDVVVNAAWYEFNLLAMKACIAAKTNYIDLGGLYHMTLKQLKLNNRAKRAGVLCLLGMGSTPGTTNIMANYAAKLFHKIDSVEIRSGWRLLEKIKKPIIPFSIRTIYDEYTLPAPILRNGKIKFVNPESKEIYFEFPKPLGKVQGHYSIHSELATLPKTLGTGIKEMDFAVSYQKEFDNLVDKTLEKFPRKEKFIEEMKKQTKIPEKDSVDVDGQRVDIAGWTGQGGRLKIRMDCITNYNKRWGGGHGSDMDTGIPPSIAAQWIATGKIKAKGAMPPEIAFSGLETEYFKELYKHGGSIKIYQSINRGRYKALF